VTSGNRRVFVADCIARSLGVGIVGFTSKTRHTRPGASTPMCRAVRLLRGVDDAELRDR
jgi:hypothetical protein